MSNLRRKFANKFETKQNVSYTISGLLGNSLGIVKVPNRANYVYVRLAGSGVAEVFNNRVTAIYDLPVICGYDPVDPRRFQVLSIQGAITEAVGSSLDFGSGYAPANRYRWLYPGGGQDPLMVEGRQFMPLRITPTSGLKFRIESQIIWDGTGWKTFGGSTETDLTSLVPTTDGKCCMVLITIDEDGIIATTKGNEVDIANLVVTDIPIPPAGTLMVLGSIRLYYGQTAIQEARTNTDIADGRFSGWDEGVGSPSWNDITGKPTEFPPEAHTHVGADILDLSVYLGNIGDIPVNMISPSAGDLLVINSGSAESLFDPDNLVKDGSVSPANLFDGNKTNQWVSTEAKNWAAFDFEYSAYVSKIVITANAGDWMWADFPNDIYIWGSHTGTFTGEETEMDHYAPTATGVYTREFSEPRTAYRYYKIDFGRPSHGCRVNELEIYVVSAPTRFENRKLVEADITDLDHDAVKIDGITVDLTGISDGEALVYDSTGTKIIPGSGGGGASAMSGLSDVDLTGLADDDILVYDSTSSKWLPEAKPAGGGEGGGTSGDWLEFIDGALVVETGVGGTYIVPRDSTIEAVMIHCKDQGSTGSTIVDVNLNGTTIFTTQSGRPELAYDDADGVATSGTPDVVTLVAGDILTIDIDQIATGAESLSVLVAMHTTITLGSMSNLSDVDLTGIVDGNVLVYDGTNSKFIAGEGGGTGGADILEVQVFM